MSASARDRWRASAASVKRRATHLFADQVHWTALRAKIQHIFRDIDALLLPTTVLPALAVETVDASMEMYTEHNLQYLRNTAMDNVLNLCGLSVLCGFTSQRSPIGFTIYGKPF
jgi:Asp-tRNA(Asn)/Glu-tRNA(Gln) amidotransferase A subunit family amidase